MDIRVVQEEDEEEQEEEKKQNFDNRINFNTETDQLQDNNMELKQPGNIQKNRPELKINLQKVLKSDKPTIHINPIKSKENKPITINSDDSDEDEDEFNQEMITQKNNNNKFNSSAASHLPLDSIGQSNLQKSHKIQQSINKSITKEDVKIKNKYKHLDQIQGIKQTLTNDQEIANNLMKDLKLCIKKENQLVKIQNQLAQQLMSVSSKEQLAYLAFSLKRTGQALNRINEKQLKYKELIQTQIEPSLKGYSAEVSSLKKSLQEYEKLNRMKEKKEMQKQKKRDQKEGKEKEKDKKQGEEAGKDKTGGGAGKGQGQKNEGDNDQEKREQQKINNEIRLSGVNLATNLRLYILNRNSEFKAIMQHIANKQMDYHSFALSKLLTVTQQVLAIEGFNSLNQKEIKEMVSNVAYYEQMMETEQTKLTHPNLSRMGSRQDSRISSYTKFGTQNRLGTQTRMGTYKHLDSQKKI